MGGRALRLRAGQAGRAGGAGSHACSAKAVAERERPIGQVDCVGKYHHAHVLTPAESSTLDDKTVAYVLETGRAFDDLRQVLSQLAGLLVLDRSGAKSGGPEHPVLGAAADTLRQAADVVRRAQPT